VDSTEVEFAKTFMPISVTKMIEKQSVVDRINLSHLDKLQEHEVEKLTTGYEPKQTIKSSVVMKIIF